MRIGTGAALCVAFLWMAAPAHADVVLNYDFEGGSTSERLTNKATPHPGIVVGSFANRGIDTFSTTSTSDTGSRAWFLDENSGQWSGGLNLSDAHAYTAFSVTAGHIADISRFRVRYRRSGSSSPTRMTVLIWDTATSSVVSKVLDNGALSGTGSYQTKNRYTNVLLAPGDYELRYYFHDASGTYSVRVDNVKLWSNWHTPVAEPASVALCLAGGVAVWWRRRRRRA